MGCLFVVWTIGRININYSWSCIINLIKNEIANSNSNFVLFRNIVKDFWMEIYSYTKFDSFSFRFFFFCYIYNNWRLISNILKCHLLYWKLFFFWIFRNRIGMIFKIFKSILKNWFSVINNDIQVLNFCSFEKKNSNFIETNNLIYPFSRNSISMFFFIR